MKQGQKLLSLFFLFIFMIFSAPQASSEDTSFWREGGGGDPAPELERLSQALIRLAEKVRPAVVQVRVSLLEAASEDGAVQQPTSSRGSGFIIHPQGYMLTAYHVVERAKEVEVRLADRRRLRAQIIASDPRVDVSLLKIERGGGLPVVALGDSEPLKVGEVVGVLGYPFGTESSLSLGIISRKGRRLGLSAGFDFLQTDAGASAGESGGPLVNTRGDVVGMITMASERGNMGFAVPIAVIKEMIPRLVRREKIVWGWLGVRVSELTLGMADSFGLSPARGVLVSAVLPGQPAERSGLLSRDVIVSVDGIPVDNPREVIRMIGGVESGREVKLTVFRRGQMVDLVVRLGTRPKTSQGREG